jgi:hypothetical protein
MRIIEFIKGLFIGSIHETEFITLLKEALEDYPKSKATWCVFEFNAHEAKTSFSNLKWNIEGEYPLKLSLISQDQSLRSFLKLKDMKRSKIQKEAPVLLRTINSHYHEFIKIILEKYKAMTLEDVDPNVEQLDEQTELRALEWVRVSLRTLKGAIKSCLDDKDKIFQCSLYFGVNPKTSQETWRIIAFNLDIFVFFRNDGVIQVTVYNDFDWTNQISQKPALQALFTRLKNPLMDELIQLLSEIGAAAQLKPDLEIVK